MSKQEIQFAKTHLRNHLAQLVLPHVSDGIWSIYENAKTVCEKNREIDQTLKTFQNLLTRVAVWNEDVLRQETHRIELATKCEYLEELLTGVFLAYMRAFAAMQYRSSADAIEIEFDKPSLDKFIHELYKQVARGAWTHAYLFKTYGVTTEQQARNRKEINQILEDSIDTVIDSFLPWKDIAKNYFKEVQLPATETVAQTVEDHDEEEEEDKPKKGGIQWHPEVAEPSEDDDDRVQPALTLEDTMESVELGIEDISEEAPKPPVEESVDLAVPAEGGDSLVLKL